jgi:four helix bundle protein
MQVGESNSPLSSMRDHRSLVAWQVARALVSQVMAITREHYHPRVSTIFSQMQSASLSVQLNIAEGYARQSTRSFRHHLTIAYGSAVETAELLDLCMAENIVPESVVEPARQQCSRAQALIMG